MILPILLQILWRWTPKMKSTVKISHNTACIRKGNQLSLVKKEKRKSEKELILSLLMQVPSMGIRHSQFNGFWFSISSGQTPCCIAEYSLTFLEWMDRVKIVFLQDYSSRRERKSLNEFHFDTALFVSLQGIQKKVLWNFLLINELTKTLDRQWYPLQSLRL